MTGGVDRGFGEGCVGSRAQLIRRHGGQVWSHWHGCELCPGAGRSRGGRVIKVHRFIFLVNFFSCSSGWPFCYFSGETVGILRHFAVYPIFDANHRCL
jgi:hypothetical protein